MPRRDWLLHSFSNPLAQLGTFISVKEFHVTNIKKRSTGFINVIDI